MTFTADVALPSYRVAGAQLTIQNVATVASEEEGRWIISYVLCAVKSVEAEQAEQRCRYVWYTQDAEAAERYAWPEQNGSWSDAPAVKKRWQAYRKANLAQFQTELVQLLQVSFVSDRDSDTEAQALSDAKLLPALANVESP